jgi:hypothetical protein
MLVPARLAAQATSGLLNFIIISLGFPAKILFTSRDRMGFLRTIQLSIKVCE